MCAPEQHQVDMLQRWEDELMYMDARNLQTKAKRTSFCVDAVLGCVLTVQTASLLTQPQHVTTLQWWPHHTSDHQPHAVSSQLQYGVQNSCLTCFEVKQRRATATGNWTQATWLVEPVFCHSATTTGQPPETRNYFHPYWSSDGTIIQSGCRVCV